MVEGSLLLNKALNEVLNLKVGEEFTVKDLFPGYAWKRIEKKDRLALGAEFFRFVNSSDNLLPIKAIGKTKSHKQKYIIQAASFSSTDSYCAYEEDDEDE